MYVGGAGGNAGGGGNCVGGTWEYVGGLATGWKVRGGCLGGLYVCVWRLGGGGCCLGRLGGGGGGCGVRAKGLWRASSLSSSLSSPVLSAWGLPFILISGRSAGVGSFMPHRPTLVPRSTTRTPLMCAYCLAALRAVSCCSVSTENTLSAFVRLMAENRATCASWEGALSRSLLSAGRGTLLQPFKSLLCVPKC